MNAPASTPITYTLKHPVELRTASGEVTQTLTSLTLRRLKGRDMRKLDGASGNGSALLALLAASADLPPSTADQLDAEDVTDAGAVVAGFLGGSLPTGAM